MVLNLNLFYFSRFVTSSEFHAEVSNRNQGKNKIVIIGSSHAKRIFYALKKKEEIRKHFFILNEAKSGSLYEQNTIPSYVNKLTENDILILQLFGNDWLQKYIKCTRKDKARKFHLLKFEPVPQSKIMAKYAHLKEILSRLKCKVLFIDNVYRHLNCCSQHIHKEVWKFWTTKNKELSKYFTSQNVKVLDHRKLLSRFPRKNIVCKGFYVKQLVDDVHLRGYLYKNLTETLIKREIMKIC